MAAKCQCPKCKKMLKEEGDQGKQAQGEYRVYDNLGNSAVAAGKHRIVECLACGYMGRCDAKIDDWWDEEELGPHPYPRVARP